MELVRRSGWGAAEPRGKPVPIPTPVRDLYLHHSVTPDNGWETVRAMQRFHQDTRGWADIAYTWLYSPRDRLFYEGRGPGIAGAHTRNHNKTSHAVCVLGNYEATKPPDHVVEDLAEWARWHGTAYGPDQYQGHRDVSATACPGAHLYALMPEINAAARDQFAPFPAADPEPDLPPTIRLGDQGDDVKFLQAAVMPHDGMFGPQTHDALVQYQRRNGLTADGICGPKTWRVILGL